MKTIAVVLLTLVLGTLGILFAFYMRDCYVLRASCADLAAACALGTALSAVVLLYWTLRGIAWVCRKSEWSQR